MHCDSLDIQHRMRLEIVELLVPHFYKSLQSAESVSQYHDVWGVLGNLFFVAHNEEEDSIYEMRSHSNQHEAEFISAFCTYLLNVGFKSHQITVLTMYVGQVFLLKKYIPRDMSVRITTVDKYQGEENEIILISLVRSNKNDKIGFLKYQTGSVLHCHEQRKACTFSGMQNFFVAQAFSGEIF